MVDCSARGLTAVPAGIPNATVELQLQDNLIDELGGNNELRGLAQLRELNLADNRLVRLEAAAFAGLGDLRELDLSNNQLVQLPGAIFAGLGQLTTLRFMNNRIRNISKGLLDPVHSVQELDFAGNRFSGCGLPPAPFRNLSQLRRVSFDNLECGELSENEGDWRFHPRTEPFTWSQDVPCSFRVQERVHLCGLSPDAAVYLNRALWRKYVPTCWDVPQGHVAHGWLDQYVPTKPYDGRDWREVESVEKPPGWRDASSWPMCKVLGCSDSKADRIGCTYDSQAACDADQLCAWTGAQGKCKPCSCAGCPVPSCDAKEILAEAAIWETACAEEYERLKTNPELVGSKLKPIADSDSGLGGNPWNPPAP